MHPLRSRFAAGLVCVAAACAKSPPPPAAAPAPTVPTAVAETPAPVPPPAAQTPAAATATDTAKQWGYEDDEAHVGPTHWAELPGNATCATGTRQAPIALSSKGAVAENLANLVFRYVASATRLTHNGHTVQATLERGSTLWALGKMYSLVQFHAHAPSEHTLDGKHFALELHFVHVDDKGRPAAVVGVFVEEGADNPALDAYFANLPTVKGATASADKPIDVPKALPTSKLFFTYTGSLTTPPCTEGLVWFVLKAPIQASKTQIARFTEAAHLQGSNRPIQELLGRTVQLDETP